MIGFLLGSLGFAQILKGGAGDDRLAVFGGGPIVFSRWIGMFCIVFLYNFDVKKTLKLFVFLILCIINVIQW